MDDNRVEGGVSYLLQELIRLNLFHGVALGGSYAEVLAPFLELESFLVIGIDYILDDGLINILKSLGLEIGNDIFDFDEASCINIETQRSCIVPEHRSQCPGYLLVLISISPLLLRHHSMHYFIL